MKLLITGGAGYIGSITNAILKEAGHETVIFDNLSRGYKEAAGDTRLIVGDLTRKADIEQVLQEESFDAVIHFAALALAGESMEKPDQYYENNIIGGLNLLEAMRLGQCKYIIFSSTCAVYGYPASLPVTEEEKIKPVSVYGSSKRMFEEILGWYGELFGIRSVMLRYFNAAGALLDGSLGERHDPETHIIPIALDVASGKRATFELFGSDHDTKDGTCIRDYIHVVDLAHAHIHAVDYLIRGGLSTAINLGVGKGYSNREVIETISRVTGKPVPIVEKPRRPGDPAQIYADNTKAKAVLGWEPRYSDIQTIVESAWKWYQKGLV